MGFRLELGLLDAVPPPPLLSIVNLKYLVYVYLFIDIKYLVDKIQQTTAMMSKEVLDQINVSLSPLTFSSAEAGPI